MSQLLVNKEKQKPIAKASSLRNLWKLRSKEICTLNIMRVVWVPWSDAKEIIMDSIKSPYKSNIHS